MTNPGPPGGDERPLTVSDPVVLEPDPLLAGDPLTDDLSVTPPPSRPAAPAFGPVSDSPVYDEVLSTSEDFETIGDTGGGAVFGEVADADGGGALDKVKAFAARSPQVFLGVALVAGYLLGRMFSSSDDDDDES